MKLNKNWAFAIPFIWFTLGVLYARTLEPFAGIGTIILTIVSSLGIFAGVSTWRITNKIVYGIIATVGFTLLIFILINIAVRFGN